MHPIDYLLHLDRYLQPIIHTFGLYIYALLFLIIFGETGFVVTPFLPGDSLLFIVGAFSANGYLNIWISYILFLLAAILGNMLNYWIGYKFGHKFFTHKDSRWLNKENLQRTHEFFEHYGGKTIIISRFIPFVRTFAPFVAGMGSMKHSTFMLYNAIGGFLWVTSITFIGYFFGRSPLVKNNFEIAIFAIVIISLLPAFIEYIKHKQRKSKANSSK